MSNVKLTPASLPPPTPTVNALSLRLADFTTLADALDYAAEGETGANFYSGRGKLTAVLPYRVLRLQAITLARRLLSLSLERGARVAVVAETNPDFLRFFFACQYVGLVPVALPAVVNIGGHEAYVTKLRGLLKSCGASVAVASSQLLPFLSEAAEGAGLTFIGAPAAFDALPEQDIKLQPSAPTETAYLQYTSGSTGFPRGVVITQQTVLANLAGTVTDGLEIRADDRCVSWLPFYHDMGLVGCMLALVATQRSVDYLDTRDFAMRPRRWLELMSRARATISFGPPFGYALCAHRVRPEDVAQYDLSAWRIAGIGAEPIRHELTDRFAKLLAPAGFDARAFVPSYGMAESSLAISFSPPRDGVVVDWIDADELAENMRAKPVAAGEGSAFVRCGTALPGHEIAIYDDQGKVLPELHVGRIKVRGPSVMSGYFESPEQTQQALSAAGWLDTGDLGYLVDGSIVITGRHKDMLIINGRNIWPQDIEHIVERQPELRSQDASAFCVPDPDGLEVAVVVVQYNFNDSPEGSLLVQRLQREIHQELGISCLIELVPRHTLPRTSSGKLSRTATREGYLYRRESERANADDDVDEETLSMITPNIFVGQSLMGKAAETIGASLNNLNIPQSGNGSVLALTGATGFIGTRLLSHLTDAGWRVRALYRVKKGRTPPSIPGVEWLAGDLEDDNALNTLVMGTSAVIHCAGAVRGASRADFDQVNEAGAQRVALAAARQTDMPRFLLISSLAARVPELSHYAGSKWRGECAVKAASENLRWTVLRPPAVFGPGDRELLPLFRSIANGFAPLPAGGKGRFSMLYVDDLATAIVHWLAVDDGYGQTLELDDGRTGGYDWDTVLDIGGRVLRDGASVRRIPIPVALLNFVAFTNLVAAHLFGYAPMLTPGKVREITHTDWVCDNHEFMQITGWQPAFGLERGLAHIFGKNLTES